jgi:hypothetical protein
MRLPHGWNAVFLGEDSKKIVCHKPGRFNTRRICFQYEPDRRYLKRIDCKTGTTATDAFNRIPDDCLQLIMTEARRRWEMLPRRSQK